MKHILIIGFWTLAVMVLAVGCTPEQGEEPTAIASTRFVLQKPHHTSAYDATVAVDQLVWEVYDAQGHKVSALGGSTLDFHTGTYYVDIDLVEEQTYTVVFWAQQSHNEVFTYTDLTDIRLDYTHASTNDASIDAFYGSLIVDNHTLTQHTIPLQRPFAQINLFVSQTAWDATMTTSSITVSDVASGFNAMTGKVTTTTQDVTLAATSNQTLADVTLTIDETPQTYKHVAMGYILPSTIGKSVVDITFTLSDGNGKTKTVKAANTMVEANYRTNVIL